MRCRWGARGALCGRAGPLVTTAPPASPAGTMLLFYATFVIFFTLATVFYRDNTAYVRRQARASRRAPGAEQKAVPPAQCLLHDGAHEVHAAEQGNRQCVPTAALARSLLCMKVCLCPTDGRAFNLISSVDDVRARAAIALLGVRPPC